jgi:hypothetical protein
MKITLPLLGRVLAGVLLLLILLALSFLMLSLFAPARITVTTSGAAVGAAAFGPVPSETLTQLGGFAVGGVQGTLSCAR